MTGSPTDHPVLDRIFSVVEKANTHEFSRFSRECECIEFWDGEDGEWYEIVVRQIDEPSRHPLE